MLLVKESVRWLAKEGGNDEAFASLVRVRGGEDNEEVRAEFAEILAGLEEEIRGTEGRTWKELMLPANRFRVLSLSPCSWVLRLFHATCFKAANSS
jgi:hypothetical protein